MFSAWLHKFNQLPGSIPNVCETFLVVAPTPTPLEGRVCAKWRPPFPLVNVAPKKCTFSPLIQHWEGEGGGGNRRGAIFSEKVQVSQHFCPGLSELNRIFTNYVWPWNIIWPISCILHLLLVPERLRVLNPVVFFSCGQNLHWLVEEQ